MSNKYLLTLWVPGWTTGIEWIKIFDKETAAKANGQYRLLLVDGHNSHYTRVCPRPSDIGSMLPSTYVLQGLDVAVFVTVKHVLSKERGKFERETGQEINKRNFLAIYGAAHPRALKSAY
jgi:hypothetical protein